MPYEVSLREVPAIKAMTKRFVTTMGTVSSDMGKNLAGIWEYIQENGGAPTGECFALYHDENFDGDRMDVETGVAVEELLPGGDGVTGRVVEGGLHASAIHKGPYSGLTAAYAAVGKWVAENGRTPLSPTRDIYLNDPGMVAEEELLTEILWPVR